MDNIPIVSGSPLKPPRKQQNIDNYLLQLPVEIFLRIADFLTPPDLVLFSETCCSLHAIFQKRTSTTKLSLADYFSYLAVHAREQPEKWVCWRCKTLHPTAKLDTPTARFPESSCPLELKESIRLRHCQIELGHHHIQLALKYTRLQEQKYNSYLQALLAPYHDLDFNKSEYVPKAHYSAYPKIAIDCNGNFKFLLLSIWRYFNSWISLHHIDALPICPHITFNSNRPWIPHYMVCRLDEATRLDVAIKGALEAIDVGLEAESGILEHTGACPRCATDFLFQLDSKSEFLDVYVWQDFGPEGSPGDLAWETHRSGVGLDGVPNNWRCGPTLYHEPGTVMELYEEKEECESEGLAKMAMGIFSQ